MFEYHGYWFFSLREDKVHQAKDLLDEYTILNCPQECVGPFKTQAGAERYKAAHPNASKDFHQMLKEMEEFYFGEYNQVSSL